MENEKALVNLEGLPEDIKKEIMADGAQYSQERVPMAPTIGISSDDETVGQFYIDYPEERGGRKLMGKELDLVIMKEKKTFSYYNDQTKKLELFSNEMDVANGKVPFLHPVVIKDNDGNVVFSGTYEQFIEAKKSLWIDPKSIASQYPKSLLKQKTLLYVYVPSEKENNGGIVRLFVNLSSSVGVDPNGGYLFSDPEPLSLEDLRKKKTGIAPYTYVVRLTNVRGEGSIPWRQLKFSYLVDVPTDQIVSMFNIKREVEKYCDIMNQMFGVSKLQMSDNNQAMINQQEKKSLAARVPIEAREELPTIQVDEPMEEQIDNITFGQAKNEGFDVSKIPF